MNLLVRTGAGRLRDSKIRRSGAQGDFGGGKWIPGLRGARFDSVCRTYGASDSFFGVYPPLTRWANVFRTSGAGEKQIPRTARGRRERVRDDGVETEAGPSLRLLAAGRLGMTGCWRGAKGSRR